MKTSEKYYTENLYPLQDGILKIIAEENLPFYLTGGTALSRFYFNHRYSDDLDLFVNDYKDFDLLISVMKKILEKNLFTIKLNEVKFSSDFVSLLIIKNDIHLKIDFVNDKSFHYGEINLINGFKIDNIRNILSNKLTALSRYEPKDIADIYYICKNYKFKWNEIINEAIEKDLSASSEYASEIVFSFNSKLLDKIKWIKNPNLNIFETEIKIIAKEILEGKDNSLYNEL